MSDNEQHESSMSTSECPEWASDRECDGGNGEDRDVGSEDGDVVFSGGGRADNVCLDPPADKEAVGKIMRIDGVKKGRRAAKKHPKRARPNRIRSRAFVGTLNNPTATDKQYYKSVSLEEMSWIVAEEEIAPDTGTPHLQMACHFKSQTDIGKARRIFGLNRAHVEIMKGTCEQSFQYCSKDKDTSAYFLERGVRPADKGKESKMKLLSMVANIKEGASDKMIFEKNPAMYLRYVA